jgi:hypothetical protein
MEEFYQGLIAGVALLGGLCGFIYWIFGQMEKRLEIKLESISADVHRVVEDLKEERRSKDSLYKFVMDNYKGK